MRWIQLHEPDGTAVTLNLSNVTGVWAGGGKDGLGNQKATSLGLTSGFGLDVREDYAEVLRLIVLAEECES